MNTEQAAIDIIEIFEDFLRARGIRVSTSDVQMKADDDYEGNDAIIYGDDFGELQQDIADTLDWKIQMAFTGAIGRA